MAATNQTGDGTSWPATVEESANGDGSSSFWANTFVPLLNRTKYLYDLLKGSAFERHSVVLINSAGPVSEAYSGTGANSRPVVATKDHSSASTPGIDILLTNLPQGATVTGIVVTSTGYSNVGGSYVAATYQVLKLPNTGASPVALSSAVSDTHNSAAWSAGTTATTPVALTAGSFIVDNANMYILRVVPAYAATSASGDVSDVKVVGTL